MPKVQYSNGVFIAPLHGLRGFMALWIWAFHATTTPIAGISIHRYGYLAVDVFFVLSGFVLMHSHGEGLHRLSIVSVRGFLVKRWHRTIPLFLASVILEFAIFVWLNQRLPPLVNFAQSLALTEGWLYLGLGLNVPTWSLGVEWLGYVAFPLIAFVLARTFRPAPLIAIILAASMVEILFFAEQRDLNNTTAILAISRMGCGFVAGCALWQLSRIDHLNKSGDAWLIFGALGVALLLSFGPQIAALPFLILVVYGVAKSGRLSRLVFGNPIALFLGRVSFSLYLAFPMAESDHDVPARRGRSPRPSSLHPDVFRGICRERLSPLHDDRRAIPACIPRWSCSR